MIFRSSEQGVYSGARLSPSGRGMARQPAARGRPAPAEPACPRLKAHRRARGRSYHLASSAATWQSSESRHAATHRAIPQPAPRARGSARAVDSTALAMIFSQNAYQPRMNTDGHKFRIKPAHTKPRRYEENLRQDEQDLLDADWILPIATGEKTSNIQRATSKDHRFVKSYGQLRVKTVLRTQQNLT